jgi:hypothetical protein
MAPARILSEQLRFETLEAMVQYYSQAFTDTVKKFSPGLFTFSHPQYSLYMKSGHRCFTVGSVSCPVQQWGLMTSTVAAVRDGTPLVT